jgi:hexosaminidase
MALITNVLFPLLCLCSFVLADLLGIPTVPFTITSNSKFDVSSITVITVDSRYASTTDEDGWTLIPPTLQEFASTFAEDLREVAGCHVSVDLGDRCDERGIFLTIERSDEFVDAAGRFTPEGYRIDVTESGITITGASPLGAWWGTRTVLQQAVLNEGAIAVGSGTDSPGWGTRGVTLDGGRHYCKRNCKMLRNARLTLL